MESEEELEGDLGQGWRASGVQGADHRSWGAEPELKLGAKGKQLSRVYALAWAWGTSKIKRSAGPRWRSRFVMLPALPLRKRPSRGNIGFDVAPARMVTGSQNREFEFRWASLARG